MRRFLVLALVLASAGCFGDGNTPSDESGTPPPPDDGMDHDHDMMMNASMAEEMYVVATDSGNNPEAIFNLRPAEFSFAQGTLVNLTFKAAIGNLQSHSLILEGHDVSLGPLPAGEAESVLFTASEKGIFAFYCGVAGHRQLGMEGSLTVE